MDDRGICAPVSGASYMRQKKLLTLVPISSATLWRKVKAGTFVKPVKLSARITAWNTAEVYEWLKQQGGK
jgi:prophage regulatory protein